MENNLELKQIKPLFKYIGGKSWLRNTLRDKLSLALNNKNYKSYCEPFAGGLGSFLSIYDILLSKGISKVLLSDINESIIYTYNAIKDEPLELAERFLVIEKGFVDSVNKEWKETKDKDLVKSYLKDAEQYFNSVKKDFNKNKNHVSLIQSARLIFLQKHSFNGVYRENSKGEYNTPFNWSGNDMLNSFSDKVIELSNVFNLFKLEFRVSKFSDLDFKNDTLYYLDPPYINDNISENKYSKNLFGLSEQINLIDKIKDVSFIYSNHKSDVLLSELSNIEGITIEEFARKNIMSASVKSRQEDKIEILVSKI